MALITFNALTAARWISFPQHVPYYLWPFSNGAMAAITFAGIVTSVIFLGAHRWQSPAKKISWPLVWRFALDRRMDSHAARDLQDPSDTDLESL
jgi:zinc transporter ZupT